MKILMIAINDPAGTAIKFTKAINRYTSHICRLITKQIRYNFMFEKDLHLPWLDAEGWEEVEELLRMSDVFHFHMTADEYLELGPFKPVDYLKGKSLVHHHHGHPEFRSNPEQYREKYKRLKRRAIVSTPDLLKLMPDANWQPNLVPINDPLYMPVDLAASGSVRVCQAPTRKDLKNTDDFERIVTKLQKRHPMFESVVIENTEHMECLRIKQTCHIHFDHMQGYFGVSSLESLSQGKPVIAGIDAWNDSKIRAFTGANDLPWVVARSSSDLETQIEKLFMDARKRRYLGNAGRDFMMDYWNEKQILQPLLKLYET